MIVQSSQSKSMICPIARSVIVPGRCDNYGDSFALRCAGKECAAWRWDEPLLRRFIVAKNVNAAEEIESDGSQQAGERIPDGWQFVPSGKDPAGWVEPEETATARRLGYCGLGGEIKPGCG